MRGLSPGGPGGAPLIRFDGITGHLREKNILSSLLERGRVPHALLFTGPPGTGKMMMAERFIAACLCAGAPRPCGSCPSCRQAQAGTHPDLIKIQPNERGTIPIGTESKKEEGTARWLISRLANKPVSGRFGVIINGAERITDEGQNALLKTIEEPGEGTVIVLISPGRGRLPGTIISRCFEVTFSPLMDAEVAAILAERGMGPEQAAETARYSCGSMQNALLLSNGDVMGEIALLCGSINEYLAGGRFADLPLDAPLKRLGADTLTDLLAGIYRRNLASALVGEPAPGPLGAAASAAGPERLQEVVKIFLAMKKGQSHNLNMRLSLKAMLYSL